MNNHLLAAKAWCGRLIPLLACILLLGACSKNSDDPTPQYPVMNNTTWSATVTVTGNTSTQNIFEFSGNGTSFAWHPAAAPSYTGTWTQSGQTVTFLFKETTTTGTYYWDNTGTLSADGKSLTGTMQRRGAPGSGTFSAARI